MEVKFWLEWVYEKKGGEKLGKGRLGKFFKGFVVKRGKEVRGVVGKESGVMKIIF